MLEQVKQLNAQLTEQLKAFEAKPTKAENKRIRLTLTALKKAATPARQELVKLEKGE